MTTAWGVGSSVPSISTIQSFQTADFLADSKESFLWAFPPNLVPSFSSLVTLAVSRADF